MHRLWLLTIGMMVACVELPTTGSTDEDLTVCGVVESWEEECLPLPSRCGGGGRFGDVRSCSLSECCRAVYDFVHDEWTWVCVTSTPRCGNWFPPP